MDNKDTNRSAFLTAAVYCAIFLLMLVCNILTPYVADDFAYSFNFYNDAPLQSFGDVILSMRAHRYSMNGRILAHTLVQILSMMPLWVFDLVNAAMYVLQITLLYRISRGNSQRSPGVLLALFCASWLFCPAFGQVNLWQDGACNYLWGTVFVLLFLVPYINAYLYSCAISTVSGKLLFLCLSFCMGAYNEAMSAAAIFIAVLLVWSMSVFQKQRKNGLWILGILTAFLGYVSIYTAPAQWRQKSAERELSALIHNFANASALYWNLFGVLLVVFAVLLLVNVFQKTDRRRILLALIFLAGSAAANYILIFANFYPPRSATGAYLFLMCAVGLLVYPVVSSVKKRPLLVAALILLLLISVPALANGIQDIYNTHSGIRSNQKTIAQNKAAGIFEIKLPIIETTTKYSALNGLIYLDTETSDTWPNIFMARYYAVNSILGVNHK